jgi:hypothetical protein
MAACAVCASNLLPYAQCALAIGYRMRSVRQKFATVCAVDANKADHMLILPIYLNQVLPIKKCKIRESYFDTFKWTSRESKTTFFGANSKSKIVASVHCAYASKDKMVRIWPTKKKKISSLKTPTYRDIMT